MKVSAVIGLGFGDEGKGRTVSSLVSRSKHPLVIRFNGGQQAGHTVQTGTLRHVFSNFGSGTLQGAPTYWSKHCTVYPTGLMNEYSALVEAGINPTIYIDPRCPVTTPYDVWKNKNNGTNGATCGVGIGTTMERHEKFFKLHFLDLFNKKVLEEKLSLIANVYYNNSVPNSTTWAEFKQSMDSFLKAVEDIRTLKLGRFEGNVGDVVRVSRYTDFIFEGAQGILLDQDYGFFPYVTRSNTTSKNVRQILKEAAIAYDFDIYYVSRVYQTRHGKGFMSDERELILTNNEKETNVQNPWQGNFRKGLLDVDLIKHALTIDSQEHGGHGRAHLVLTCLDQVDRDKYYAIQDGIIFCCRPEEVHKYISNEWYSVTQTRTAST